MARTAVFRLAVITSLRLYIGGCLSAMQKAISTSSKHINIYNLGTDDVCDVSDSASWIAVRMGLNPEFTFTGGKRGWAGDSPFIYLDTKKIQQLGWVPN